MTAQPERWLPVVDFEGIYEVSDYGRVRRIKAAQGTRVGTILTPIVNAHGYWVYSLHNTGWRVKRTAHRLVLTAFVGARPELLALHFDDDPANNHISNLRWGTPLDNGADWKRNGIRTFPNQNAVKTHCKNGHEFSEENTYRKPSRAGRNGSRVCRTCAARDGRKRKRMKQAA